MHCLRTLLILAAAAAAARGAPTAIEFTQVTTNSANARPTKMDILLQGDRFTARSTDDESRFPPPGSYMLGSGGHIYIVVPSQRAYAKFDPDEIKQMAQQATAGRPGSHRVGMPGGHATGNDQGDSDYSHAIENFKFTKELDEAGPRMFGYATRHYRYHLSYDDVTHVKANEKPIVGKYDEVTEFWSTDAFGTMSEMLKRVGFRVPESKSGDYDQVEQARHSMLQHGLMLKCVTKTKDTQNLPMGGMMNAFMKLSRAGRGSTRTVTEEITALSEVHPPSDAFALPRDFQETDMMSLFTAAGGGMPDLSGAGGDRTGRQPAMPDLDSQGN